MNTISLEIPLWPLKTSGTLFAYIFQLLLTTNSGNERGTQTMRLFQMAVLCAAMVVATAGQVRAGVVIDFQALPNGPVTTIGNATFSLAGTGEMGNASISSEFGGGLWNSTDGANYPTNTVLRVDFIVPVDNVKWNFNPYGINGDPGQGWTVYGAGLAALATGPFTSGGSASYDLSAYTGVTRIEWNNGRNNWLQSLERLSFDVAPVPEPASLAVWGVSALGLAIAARRNRKAE